MDLGVNIYIYTQLRECVYVFVHEKSRLLDSWFIFCTPRTVILTSG